MIRSFLFSIGVILAGLAAPSAAHAQNMPPPPGSWQQSCSDGRWDGLVFQAQCQRANGRVLLTRLDMQGYGGWVTNCDGRLTRAPDCRGVPHQNNFPTGSWRQSCADPVWDQRTIRATCRDRSGSWQSASFDTNMPFFDLSNCDGKLIGAASCTDQSLDGLPPGNWRNYCRQATLEDGILRANCIHNGEWGPRALNVRNHNGPVSFCEGAISRLPSCR